MLGERVAVDEKVFDVVAWFGGCPVWVMFRRDGEDLIKTTDTRGLRMLAALLETAADRIDAKIAEEARRQR